MSEAEFIHETEEIKSKERQEAGTNQHRVVEIFPPPSKGKTLDKIAEKVGFGSGRTYERAKKVWDSAKDGDETVKELLKKLTSKNMKITIFCKRF
jgi:ParB family transcriptional regulator, chromosome partitioning protein